MPIYKYLADQLEPFEETTFQSTGVREREDLQRLLRDQIDIIAPDTLVISEEFGEWQDSLRRVDLLGVHSSGDLVVIELKRTKDGGHMELQALRYAAMVSTMTFQRAVKIFDAYLQSRGEPPEANTLLRSHLEEHLEDVESTFGSDTQIILVSAGFSRELTTTVLWLSNQDLNIRCIKLTPYTDGEGLILDVQQIIPLPEAEDYQVSLRKKAEEKRGKNKLNERYRRFWGLLISRSATKSDLLTGRNPTSQRYFGNHVRFPGCHLHYCVFRGTLCVGLNIDHGKESDLRNKELFERLHNNKEEIESQCNCKLTWEDNGETRRSCAVRWTVKSEAIGTDESLWLEVVDELIDAMVTFEKALAQYLDK